MSECFTIWFFSKDDNLINKINHKGTLQSAHDLAKQIIKDDKQTYADYEITKLNGTIH